MNAEEAMQRIGILLDNYYEGENLFDTVAKVAQVVGEYEGSRQ